MSSFMEHIMWKKNEIRNLILLFLAQGLTILITSIYYSFNSLVAFYISNRVEISTLPISLTILGTACTVIPANIFMSKYGRRKGFLLGALCGFLASGLLCISLVFSNFLIFNLGSILVGIAIGFSQYYRFAAGEIVTSPTHKTNAISYILGAGLIGCLMGNPLANLAESIFLPYIFLGPMIIILLAYLIKLVIIYFLEFPPLENENNTASVFKDITTILFDPRFIAAHICGVVAFVSMMIFMTATPLAMSICSWGTNDVSHVVQWHFISMFAPSLFTGSLINRWGNSCVIFIGILLNLACVLIAYLGTDISNFWLSQFLLGIGWNFMFIASTDILAQSFQGALKKKAQSINEFIIYLGNALASFLVGPTLIYMQWKGLTLTVLPLFFAATLSLLYYIYNPPESTNYSR